MLLLWELKGAAVAKGKKGANEGCVIEPAMNCEQLELNPTGKLESLAEHALESSLPMARELG